MKKNLPVHTKHLSSKAHINLKRLFLLVALIGFSASYACAAFGNAYNTNDRIALKAKKK